MIDLWDVSTYDDELMALLLAREDLIRDYMVTTRMNYLEREASDHTMPYPQNPYASDFVSFRDSLMPLMSARVIRAWHYTRLTDAEVSLIRTSGIHTPSLATLQDRLNAQVIAGSFTSSIAEALYAASPCHHREQQEGRLGKFWMVSHPVEIDDSGVVLLLESWGGEAVYFWLRDEGLQSLVKTVGTPRVLELAVPIASTRHSYSAAQAAVAAFAMSLGCQPDNRSGFDLYSTRAIGADAVLAVHSAGDAKYSALARGYPAGFQKPSD